MDRSTSELCCARFGHAITAPSSTSIHVGLRPSAAAICMTRCTYSALDCMGGQYIALETIPQLVVGGLDKKPLLVSKPLAF
ncbi:hypothetical protein [Streptomyces sp. NPDC055005]